MIYWAQVFQFYQPPTQTAQGLEKACNEIYRPLLEALRQNPHIKSTLSVSGALLEMLQSGGHRDILLNMQSLGEKGSVEFMGGAKHHPILPLLPRDERKRQIEMDTLAGTSLLGKSYQPRGFFPPEMGYSNEILPDIQAAGYQWVLLSGVACPGLWPEEKIYQAQNGGNRISVLFRDDILSNEISDGRTNAGNFIKRLQYLKSDKEKIYVITATSAESIGNQDRNREGAFLNGVYELLNPLQKPPAKSEKHSIEYNKQEPTTVCPACGTRFMLVFSGNLPDIGRVTCPNCQAELTIDFKGAGEKARQELEAGNHGVQQSNGDIKTLTAGELIRLFPAGELIVPKESSWRTTAEDIANGNPYPLWRDKNNDIHALQWEHLYLCIEIVKKARESADCAECKSLSDTARGLLDASEYSHYFAWAGRQPNRDINLVQLGLIDQWRAIINAYRAINKSNVDPETKTSYYRKIVDARAIRDRIMDKILTA